jgi:hypothetical protein
MFLLLWVVEHMQFGLLIIHMQVVAVALDMPLAAAVLHSQADLAEAALVVQVELLLQQVKLVQAVAAVQMMDIVIFLVAQAGVVS